MSNNKGERERLLPRYSSVCADGGTFERSIVFTHAEISINEETYIKSDFVTMTVRINQKRDKFAGVMFGDNIDDTYRKAWQKVLNPPRLNIYVPVKVNDNKEFAPSIQENLKNNYGIKITKTSKVSFKQLPIHNFYYSNGPEDIKNSRQILLRYGDKNKEIKIYNDYINSSEKNDFKIPVKQDFTLREGYTDFGFYHKLYSDLCICIIVSNPSDRLVSITKYKPSYFSMNVVENEQDEMNKENYCAKVDKNFLENAENSIQTIDIIPNEGRILYKFEFNNHMNNSDEYYNYYSEGDYRRVYGRVRIKCIEGCGLRAKARVIVLPKDEAEDYEKLTFGTKEYKNIWLESNKFPDDIRYRTDSGQFCGVVNYTELLMNVKDMKSGEYIMLGDYAKGGEPEVVENTGAAEGDNQEYPKALYYDYREKYKYFFGNFGIVYTIKFENPETNKFKLYPFGDNGANYANILLNTNGLWKSTGSLPIGDKFTCYDFEMKGNTFKYLLPGGNCACVKIKMVK